MLWEPSNPALAPLITREPGLEVKEVYVVTRPIQEPIRLLGKEIH